MSYNIRYGGAYMKKCRLCNELKPLSAFYKDKYSKDGRKNSCKDCDNSRHECTCSYCGSTFYSSSKIAKYCSSECRGGNISRECLNCGKVFYTNRYKINNGEGKFCSKECYWTYNTGERNVQYNKQTVSCSFCNKTFQIQNKRIKLAKNLYCSIECKNKHHSVFMSGKNNSNYKGKIICYCGTCNKKIELIPSLYGVSKTHFCSKECVYMYNRHRYKGENNPNYNPNLSNEDREKSRHIPEYKQWVLDVYRRDKFKCVCCNDNSSGKLIAHHLNGYNWDKENRLNLDNGVTLCIKCHNKFHRIYGYGNNTKAQFEEFIQNMLIRMEE